METLPLSKCIYMKNYFDMAQKKSSFLAHYGQNDSHNWLDSKKKKKKGITFNGSDDHPQAKIPKMDH